MNHFNNAPAKYYVSNGIPIHERDKIPRNLVFPSYNVTEDQRFHISPPFMPPVPAMLYPQSPLYEDSQHQYFQMAQYLQNQQQVFMNQHQESFLHQPQFEIPPVLDPEEAWLVIEQQMQEPHPVQQHFYPGFSLKPDSPGSTTCSRRGSALNPSEIDVDNYPEINVENPPEINIYHSPEIICYNPMEFNVGDSREGNTFEYPEIQIDNYPEINGYNCPDTENCSDNNACNSPGNNVDNALENNCYNAEINIDNLPEIQFNNYSVMYSEFDVHNSPIITVGNLPDNGINNSLESSANSSPKDSGKNSTEGSPNERESSEVIEEKSFNIHGSLVSVLHRDSEVTALENEIKQLNNQIQNPKQRSDSAEKLFMENPAVKLALKEKAQKLKKKRRRNNSTQFSNGRCHERHHK